ncbi:MAG: exosortase-associated EpsI family protein [Armatimonadetes bacterium]|nr:exosortase-associated EpsI family protein [Armatimonadota bacterium]
MPHAGRLAVLLTPGRLAALLTLLFGGGWLVAARTRPAPPPAAAPLTGVMIPHVLLGYAGADSPLDAPTQRALAGTRLVVRTYRHGADALQCIVASGDTPGTLHDPRDCLAGGGWHVRDERDERLPGGAPAHACRAAGRPGVPDLDVVYLFVVDGRVTGNLASVRAAMLCDSLWGGGRGPDYLVRLAAPLTGAAGADAAEHAHLLAFAAQVLACLARP